MKYALQILAEWSKNGGNRRMVKGERSKIW
jgi:hypothetical protein